MHTKGVLGVEDIFYIVQIFICLLLSQRQFSRKFMIGYNPINQRFISEILFPLFSQGKVFRNFRCSIQTNTFEISDFFPKISDFSKLLSRLLRVRLRVRLIASKVLRMRLIALKIKKNSNTVAYKNYRN